MGKNEQTAELKKLRSQVKHLKNELALTKEENETAVLNYYDLYKNMEKLVEEKTSQLKNAMSTIYKYNHQLEDMLEERTKHLIQTERHAAFSILSQGIVHNLKNPLSIISAASQILRLTKPQFAKDELPEKIAEFMFQVDKNIEKVEIGTKRMLEMINSLMAKSKSDTSKAVETVNINDLIRKEIDFLSADSVFKNKVDKDISFVESDLYVDILPGELSQIFQNLVRNSLDAMHEKKDAKISIFTGFSEDEVWFSIKDNGPGISKENQSKIFDPFFSTKPSADKKTNGAPTGTGLGLHMCSQMAGNYKGRIEVISDMGKGAEFKIYFPKSAGKNSALIMN
ncbi:MAG: sensor histidine kinase [Calditrichaeota bacterium]|nr:MAG: sensor histidine kinase [Calditrichota bacterium]MBL1204060.1 sensor histidine kinase [Calditrichota bacterium]NOG43891.1 HAMP domain-containing histidine kinase [Calditrichota bacterium]